MKFTQLIGMNYNTYRGWLYNNRIPDAESACDMAKTLGVSVEYLVWGKHKQDSKGRNLFKEQKTVSANIRLLLLKLDEETKRLKTPGIDY